MNDVVELPRVYTKDEMPISVDHIPKQEKKSRKWGRNKGITWPKLDASIGLMIGNNVPDAYTPLREWQFQSLNQTQTGLMGQSIRRPEIEWPEWHIDKTIIDEYENLELESNTVNYNVLAKTVCTKERDKEVLDIRPVKPVKVNKIVTTANNTHLQEPKNEPNMTMISSIKHDENMNNIQANTVENSMSAVVKHLQKPTPDIKKFEETFRIQKVL
ncbi:unnamed protein product [Mytilus coruscus]|uniref:Uncharacterized protein n=1 Tax=Mytilus coruscus TaxID=42192 RepID=A0A6J8CBB8_MYTCO|nr:unnamed protein product [Mytilus coruscus]